MTDANKLLAAPQAVGALRLSTEQVFRRCDPASLPFVTLSELEDPVIPPGQEDTIAALRFGVSIRHPDYHIYAFAPAWVRAQHRGRATDRLA